MTTNRRKKQIAQPGPCCRDGKCPQCAEEAVWERVYRTRFADPLYYRRRPARSVSPLNGF